jgi:hypothetical protein
MIPTPPATVDDEMEKLDLRDSDLRAVSDSDTRYKV